MGEKIRVAIAGINGRFGRASAKAILADSELKLVAGFGRSNAAYAGRDIGELIGVPSIGVSISNSLLDAFDEGKPDVMLDFTDADAAIEHAKLAMERGVKPVVGTSGIMPEAVQLLTKTAKDLKMGAMIVPNFSVGAVLMMEFARQAGAFFQNVEVIEMHHTKKLDAPSGTAMWTAAKLQSNGNHFNPKEVDDRELLPGSRGGRHESGVHVHSLRLPGLISHQEVIFGAEGELLTIRHDGLTVDCYLRGILMALKAVYKLNEMAIGLEPILLAKLKDKEAACTH